VTAPSFPPENSPPPLSAGPLTPERPVSRWRWWIHLVLIGGYFASAIPFALHHPLKEPMLSGSAPSLLIRAAFQIGLFSAVFGLGWLASRASRDQMLLRWRPGWWVVPLGIGYSIALRLAAGIAAMIVIGFLLGTRVVTPEILQNFIQRNHPDVQKLVSISALRNDPAYYWLTLTLVSFVLAGLREELWRAGTLAALRVLWPSAFASMRGQILAIGLIAIVFGAVHFPLGPLGTGMATIVGFLLGLIMVLHRSIWPAVIAHGFFDATTFALLPLTWEKLQHLP
jgi:membrane protease YdiL (CAAX protease family)